MEICTLLPISPTSRHCPQPPKNLNLTKIKSTHGLRPVQQQDYAYELFRVAVAEVQQLLSTSIVEEYLTSTGKACKILRNKIIFLLTLCFFTGSGYQQIHKKLYHQQILFCVIVHRRNEERL